MSASAEIGIKTERGYSIPFALVRKAIAEGATKAEVARTIGCSRSMVYRILRAAPGEQPEGGRE